MHYANATFSDVQHRVEVTDALQFRTQIHYTSAKLSILTLLPFFVAQVRSLIATTNRQRSSDVLGLTCTFPFNYCMCMNEDAVALIFSLSHIQTYFNQKKLKYAKRMILQLAKNPKNRLKSLLNV